MSEYQVKGCCPKRSASLRYARAGSLALTRCSPLLAHAQRLRRAHMLRARTLDGMLAASSYPLSACQRNSRLLPPGKPGSVASVSPQLRFRTHQRYARCRQLFAGGFFRLTTRLTLAPLRCAHPRWRLRARSRSGHSAAVTAPRASPRLQSFRPCARLRAPWSEAPVQSCGSVFGCLRASSCRPCCLRPCRQFLARFAGSPWRARCAASGAALLLAPGRSAAKPRLFWLRPGAFCCAACTRAALCRVQPAPFHFSASGQG